MPFLNSLSEVDARDWDRLQGAENPFLRHAFLHGLEKTGCTTARTGWAPQHWVHHGHDGKLVAAMPCYLKGHSYGEYVFDWAWAQAWAEQGLNYYPKLLTAVPFTPSVGPRLLLAPGADARAMGRAACDQLLAHGEATGASSWHLLFPDAATQAAISDHPALMTRLNCQFHWQNRGFRSFEDFLDTLNARRRKQIRKERRQVAEQGITLHHLTGSDIRPEALEAFYVFYQATYLKHGQSPYLNREFFQHLHQSLPQHLSLVMASHQGRYCAAALFLHDDSTLYGRYWGCLEEFDHLHFEACYYQGIDLCIALGLERFDAGAQGEHKLRRGFRPQQLRSYHWVAEPGFRHAVADFCQRESGAVAAYAAEAESALPFRRGDGGPD
ncbi:MAG: GNAT family N-acetyltransferase [Oleiphilaceae bacterium]|nr:GNAT family N-acetyltransferase [Oleiphilaceae bacterium]